jgi:hypothetical protein
MKVYNKKGVLVFGMILSGLIIGEISALYSNENGKMNNNKSNSLNNMQVISNKKLSQILHEVSYDRPSESYTHSTEYVMPHLTRTPQYELQSRTVIPLANIPVGLVPHQVNEVESCPCAASFPVIHCRPCGSAPLPEPEPVLPVFDCPCAPKPNCPVCPPLSLLHEIASKKVKLF